MSVINVETVTHLYSDEPMNLLADFYFIAVKRMSNVKAKYGQQQYDFIEGVMSFMSPAQVFSIALDKDEELKQSGWARLIHPDFLWNTPLVKTIKNYAFFDCSVNEALFLFQKEETIINNIIQNIQQAYHSNIDRFSKQIITSQIKSLLNYAERFYHRQFITQEKAHHQIPIYP